MSGTAFTTRSPSRVRIRRSVVCVAGCCGPKLSVQRNSLPAPLRAASSAYGSATSSGIGSAFRPSEVREVMSLAVTATRIVLPQRVADEALRHQNPPQVRMAGELNAVKVIDLALHPVGAAPERESARHRQVR